MKKMLKSKKGFTMVEIIIVLVIIAILIGASVPAMIGFVNEARGKGMAAEASTVRTALQTAMSEFLALDTSGDDPSEWTTVGGETDSIPVAVINKMNDMLGNDASGLGGDVEAGRIRMVGFDANGKITQIVLADLAGTRWINLRPGETTETGGGSESWTAPAVGGGTGTLSSDD